MTWSDEYSAPTAIKFTETRPTVIILLILLLVLIFAGAGFALHILWLLAVIFFIFWLIGVALARGERAGNHKFYKW
jgi:hypothetical protein